MVAAEKFTLVFEGSLRALEGNPFKIATPYGLPVASAIGDALEDGDRTQNRLEEAREWLEACLGQVEGRGLPNWDGIRSFLRSIE